MTVGLEWQNNLLREKNILQKENESLPFLKKFLKKFSQNKISNNSTWLILKETVSWDFLSSFFQDSNPSGPVIYLLKFFRIWSRICRDICECRKLPGVFDTTESNSALSMTLWSQTPRCHLTVQSYFYDTTESELIFFFSLPLVAL